MHPALKTLLLLLLCQLPAQLPAERVLLRVVDRTTGVGIAEATVILSGDGRRETSDAGGWIQFELFEPGIFDGMVSAPGFASRPVRLEVDPAIPDRRMEVFLSPQVVNLEAFEVTAQQTDEDRDLQAAREAIAPLNQVSGEELRDITAEGVSDALEKVAGVTVSSGDSGPGISIRGAGARQTRVTLDGQSMAGGGGRGTTRGAQAMNQVPREFLDRVQVMKAPTPDMDADAIGGTVDLQTSRIANSKSARSSLALRSAYSDPDRNWAHRLNAAHAQPFALGGGRRFGILLAVNGLAADSGGDSLQVLNQWPLRSSPTTGLDERVLARLRAGRRETRRDGLGAMLNTDLQLSKAANFQLKAMWNETSQDTASQFHTYDFIRGDIVSLTPEAAAFDRMRMEKQFLERGNRDRSGSLVLAGEQFAGDWQLEESVGYSFADSLAAGDINATFQTQRILDGGYDASAAPQTPRTFLFSGGVDVSPEDLLAPDPYQFFRYDIIDNQADDRELAVRLNAGRKWETAEAQWLFKTGIKSRLREASQDQDKLRHLPGGERFTLAAVSAPGPATVFKGLYPMGPSWSPSAMADYFTAHPGAFSVDEAGSLLDSQASDFSVSEDINAAYAMAQRESGDWVVIAGVRVERTDFSTSGYETIVKRNGNGESGVTIRPVTIDDSYTMFFPGLHVLHRLHHNWVVRASLTRTLQRPDFRDLSPSTRVDLDTKRIRSGNPELQPFDAKAFDMGTDLLLDGWGTFSFGLFAKRIGDFIVDIEEETSYLGEPGFFRSYPVNGSPADLVGIEAAWVTTLAFLPGVLDTTSLNLNYTWTDSSAAYPGHPGTIIMLPEQVRDVFNASLRWQYANWTITLRTRYQGLRLNDLIEPGQDLFNEGFWSHSASLGYKINDSFSLSIGMANLNHADRVTYQGVTSRLVANRETSRTFSIGINIRFGKGKLPGGGASGAPAPGEG